MKKLIPISSFQERLQDALESRNMRPAELSRRTGISQSTISQYRSGYSKPKDDKLAKIANALQVNPVWLMGLDTNRSLDSLINKKETSPKEIHHYHSARIPILGKVPCGIPMTVTEYADADDYVEIEETLAKTGEYYAIRAKGDSMLPRIYDGDIMVIHQQSDIESGQVAIVRINGHEATCKRIKKYHDGIELIPLNPSYEAVYFSDKDIEKLPVSIVGRVVEVRSKL